LANKMNCRNVSVSGFTMIELLIAMGIGTIVMVAVMTSFLSQHDSYLVQDNVVEMQQNSRVAIDLLASEIRMAGYNPTRTSGIGIVAATANQLSFRQDLNGDGDTLDGNERTTYGFSNANDGNADGIADAGIAPLGRDTGGGSGFQPVADNFQAIEFNYLMEDGTFTLAPAATALDEIRAIQVSLLARAVQADSKYTNTNTYTSASGRIWGGAVEGTPYNDHFRRRLIVTTIYCRNIGL
jgi:type IV pilus assembly protein PilW